MAPRARLRSWFAGGAGIGSLLNMNQCGLEDDNKELKKDIEKNSQLPRFMQRTSDYVRSKSLICDPAYTNHVSYAVNPKIPQKMWVLANYNFIESGRAASHRFVHILKAYEDDWPQVRHPCLFVIP